MDSLPAILNPLLHNPLEYHVFENIMENKHLLFWSKCSIFP